jgi:hypothetical protein
LPQAIYKDPNRSNGFQAQRRSKKHFRIIAVFGYYRNYYAGLLVENDDTDFNTFFTTMDKAARTMTHEQFLTAMDAQMTTINGLFNQISEDDLLNKEVDYPWGGKAPMGEAVITTSIKFLTGYKLQLFSLIKLCDDQKLGTADAWFLTDLS